MASSFKLSPYELLGIGRRASQREITAAYQAALRAKKHPPPVLAHAFQELRNPRKRLETDLLDFVTEGDEAAMRRAAAAGPPAVFEPLPKPAPLALRVDVAQLEIEGHRREVPPLAGSFEPPVLQPPDAPDFPLPPFPT